MVTDLRATRLKTAFRTRACISTARVHVPATSVTCLDHTEQVSSQDLACPTITAEDPELGSPNRSTHAPYCRGTAFTRRQAGFKQDTTRYIPKYLLIQYDDN